MYQMDALLTAIKSGRPQARILSSKWWKNLPIRDLKQRTSYGRTGNYCISLLVNRHNLILYLKLVDKIRITNTRDANNYQQELNRSFKSSFGPPADRWEPSTPVGTSFSCKVIQYLEVPRYLLVWLLAKYRANILHFWTTLTSRF